MLGCATPWLRWVTLVSGMMECLFSGLHLGWPSLVFILKEEGYFSDLCVNTTGANDSVTTDCSAQDARLSLVFNIALTCSDTLLFPLGLFYDRLGTMASRLLSITIHTTGSLLIAFSSTELPVLVFPGLACQAIAGPSLFVTNVQTGNLFGSRRSIPIMLLSGTVGSSPVVFLIIKILFERGIPRRSCFLFLASCSVIHLLRTFLLLPKTHIPYPLPEGYTYGLTRSSGQCNSMEQETAQANGNAQKERGRETICLVSQSVEIRPSQSSGENGRSLRSCIFSSFFLLHVLWFSGCRANAVFLYVTLNPMLFNLAKGDNTIVSSYTNAIALAQLCTVLCSPWNGLIMDRNKKKPRAQGETQREADMRAAIVSLVITPLVCLLFSICASIPVLPLQYLTFALQVMGLSFLFSVHPVYISTAFPSSFYGVLYGLVIFLSTIVLLIHYPLIILVTEVLHGDPLYVFTGFSIATLLTFIHPLNIFLHSQRLAARRQILRPVCL
ncbi:hypothetical protein GJAV_G00249650 [Gymnothorax javanicus]|nr:hypothetical protein GJAV_G00249650 [Gymnothorax javanicus]